MSEMPTLIQLLCNTIATDLGEDAVPDFILLGGGQRERLCREATTERRWVESGDIPNMYQYGNKSIKLIWTAKDDLFEPGWLDYRYAHIAHKMTEKWSMR